MKVDEILEKLDRNGYAPCIINDDNGRWAVTCDALQGVYPEGTPIPEEQEILTFTLTSRFRPTIKEAVEIFLKEEEIDINELPDNGDGDEDETR